MENASKALLIAAALLIAVLLVAFGVTIFNNARNAADMSQLNQTEITMFNQQFEKYVSNTGILGSQVKTLLSTAIANASTNKDEPNKLPEINVDVGSTVDGNTDSKENASKAIQVYIDIISDFRNNAIISNNNYKVSCDYDATTGLVERITITTP